jgi:hypothetical protein
MAGLTCRLVMAGYDILLGKWIPPERVGGGKCLLTIRYYLI